MPNARAAAQVVKDLTETSLRSLELEERAARSTWKVLFLRHDFNKLVKTLTAIVTKKTAIKKEEGEKRSRCTLVGVINSVLNRELVKILFI